MKFRGWKKVTFHFLIGALCMKYLPIYSYTFNLNYRFSVLATFQMFYSPMRIVAGIWHSVDVAHFIITECSVGTTN